MKILKSIISLMCMVSVAGIAVNAQETVEPGLIVDRIEERGHLLCGVNASLSGFGKEQADGGYAGFDIDICRAVAAAILSDASAVEFVPLSANERSLAIQTGEVDMIARNTTLTLERSAEWGIFGPITFYDGQGAMVRADSGISSLQGISGQAICVARGTTSELNIQEVLEINNISFDLEGFETTSEAFTAFENGNCDVFTTDLSGLLAFKADSDNGAEYVILTEVESEDLSNPNPLLLSKEPFAPLSSAADPRFAEIISWTVWGMIYAEELGITSRNVDTLKEASNPAIQRFLGTGTEPTGDHLGIPNDFMYQVISQVGNYGEIFNRHLGDDTPLNLDRGLNDLWTRGGLLYSPPFR